jgi:hypothetical protein
MRDTNVAKAVAHSRDLTNVETSGRRSCGGAVVYCMIRLSSYWLLEACPKRSLIIGSAWALGHKSICELLATRFQVLLEEAIDCLRLVRIQRYIGKHLRSTQLAFCDIPRGKRSRGALENTAEKKYLLRSRTANTMVLPRAGLETPFARVSRQNESWEWPSTTWKQ